MPRAPRAALAVAAAAAAAAALLAPPALAAPSFRVANDRFEKDGEPFTILSGSIHYFRVRPELWEDRLTRLKAMGLNAITFVIPWNVHTTGYRQYDFSAPERNLTAWLATAQRMGLLALVRPGPYICAEHDGGGLPWYLFGGAAPAGIQLRTNNSAYLAEVDHWWGALLPVLKPHLYSNGGNVVLWQLENEFGSFGDVSTSAADREYILHLLAQSDAHLGAGAVQYYTTDGGDTSYLSRGALPGVVFATGDGNNVGMFAAEDQFNPPGWRAHTTSEFYPGWLTHWGEAMANTSALAAVGDLTLFFGGGGSANLYMAHGGTNWGFQAGANAAADGSGYAPVITSYDYSAPLAEGGGHGWAVDGDKFAAFRTVLAYWNPEPVPDEPPAPAVAAYGAVALTHAAPLWRNQDALVAPFPDNAGVQSMEWYNISSGWALYTGTGAPSLSGPGDKYLALASNADLAATFGTNSGSLATSPAGFIARGGGVAPNPVQGVFAGNGAYPDVLLENQGRIGYGHGMQGDAKTWGGMTLGGFGVGVGQRVYGLGSLDVSTGWPSRLPWAPIGAGPAMTPLMPTFFRGTLTVPGAPADTYVSSCGWGKGVVWVNGVNLGRYWDSRGPQHTLYVPAALLRTGDNDIIVFEVNTTTTNATLEFVSEPDFTGAGCRRDGGGSASADRYPTLMLDPSLTARGRSRDAALSADVHAWRARRAVKSAAGGVPPPLVCPAACGSQPPAAGTPLTLQPCSVGAAATQWTLKPAKAGLLGGHLVLAAAPSLCLAPAAAATGRDATAVGLALAACNATDRSQDWLLFPANAHAVMSPVAGTFVHSPGSATAPGTPLALEAANAGAPNQQWAWDATSGQLVSGLGTAAAPLCAAAC
jgi:beta-galactosidase